MRPLCGARLTSRKNKGKRCRLPGLACGRCWRHGGRTGPKTPEGERRKEIARQAGYKAYVARMHEAKRLGLIDRMPWGRKPGGKNKGLPRNADTRLFNAARIIVMTELEKLPAPVDKPPEQQNMGELLATASRKSLLIVLQILDMKFIATDPETGELLMDEYGNPRVNPRVLATVKDTALSTLSLQQKVDESHMRAHSADRLPDILKRLAAIGAEPTAVETGVPQLISFEEMP